MLLSEKENIFLIGCNYWASHAGTAMWSNWQPNIVEQDLKKLSASGIQILRVFPIWPDFQPLNLMRTINGIPLEYRHGEAPLPDNKAGEAGMSSKQMSHFSRFLDMANKYNLKVVVSLITGWMSGRLFTPPALEGKNLITDPVAVMWEIRFIRYFVSHFIDDPAIIAWEPGNECNCMGAVASREEAWLWLAAIVNAIRSVDAGRPVLSGMSSIDVSSRKSWTIQDQGEIVDFLTPHPYPFFAPHGDLDPINTIRTSLLATVCGRMNADIGKKPCIVEETNSFGPMFGDEIAAADYIRTNLFSLWAHDCHGLFWWCAFDQDHLSHPPYDWSAVELELGLFRSDGKTQKSFTNEFTRFRNFLDKLPFKQLPIRKTEAVCILTGEQDQWGAAYSSFILAKQAGFDIEFQFSDQPLKKSPLYLLPCLNGCGNISQHRWHKLLEHVREGATLYISYGDGFLIPFEEITGLKIKTRERRSQPAEIIMDGLKDKPALTVNAPLKLSMKAMRCKVLGREKDGNPVFTCSNYGKGKIFFLSLPIETELIRSPGIFYNGGAKPYWEIYRHIFNSIVSERAVTKTEPQIGITEHLIDEISKIIIMINYSPYPLKTPLNIADGWRLKDVFYGKISASPRSKKRCQCFIKANDALVFSVVKNKIPA